MIIQWASPEVKIKHKVNNLGTIKADPQDYRERYASDLIQSSELPDIVQNIEHPPGIVLAADFYKNHSQLVYELHGDIEALRLIDLDMYDLSEYKAQLEIIDEKIRKK